LFWPAPQLGVYIGCVAMYVCEPLLQAQGEHIVGTSLWLLLGMGQGGDEALQGSSTFTVLVEAQIQFDCR
jgi:hypothetical protein